MVVICIIRMLKAISLLSAIPHVFCARRPRIVFIRIIYFRTFLNIIEKSEAVI